MKFRELNVMRIILVYLKIFFFFCYIETLYVKGKGENCEVFGIIHIMWWSVLHVRRKISVQKAWVVTVNGHKFILFVIVIYN